MTQNQTTTCPSCGKPTQGKFCSNCGTAASSTCGSCGTDLKAGTRFCHKCGTPVTSQQHGGPRAGSVGNVAWAALGLAALSLVLAVIALGRGMPTGPAATQGAPQPVAGAPAPDISNMSPREQADRLFNRIMSAHERGDAGETAQFRAMAIQAYGLLGDLDNDARYHVGLIHAVTGDLGAAAAQVDSLLAASPNHLLGLMLQNTVAQISGDQETVGEATRAFLAAYDAEIATNKQEYLDHGTALEGFKRDAEARAGA